MQPEAAVVSPTKNAVCAYLVLDDRRLTAQCDVDHYRSRGPGGQKRNKTSSAVRLRHRPTGLTVTASEHRSQNANRVRALRRLRQAIALQVRTELKTETYTASEGLFSCITDQGRLHVGRRDRRYDPAVCEILDVLAACDARVKATAKCVGVTTAHLVKFFQADPKLWACVNQMRKAAGVKPLR